MRKDESIFPALFNQCKSNQDRECLCRLFKEVAIKAQEFERAVQFREMQKKWRPCPVKSKPSKLGLNCSASKDRTGYRLAERNKARPIDPIPSTTPSSSKPAGNPPLWPPERRAGLDAMIDLYRLLRIGNGGRPIVEGLAQDRAIPHGSYNGRTRNRHDGLAPAWFAQSSRGRFLEHLLFLSVMPQSPSRTFPQRPATFVLSRSSFASVLRDLYSLVIRTKTLSNPDQELK